MKKEKLEKMANDSSLASMSDQQFNEFVHGVKDPLYSTPYQTFYATGFSRTNKVNKEIDISQRAHTYYLKNYEVIEKTRRRLRNAEKYKEFFDLVDKYDRVIGSTPTRFYTQHPMLRVIKKYFKYFILPKAQKFDVPERLLVQKIEQAYDKQIRLRRLDYARIQRAIRSGVVGTYCKGKILSFLEETFDAKSPVDDFSESSSSEEEEEEEEKEKEEEGEERMAAPPPQDDLMSRISEDMNQDRDRHVDLEQNAKIVKRVKEDFNREQAIQASRAMEREFERLVGPRSSEFYLQTLALKKLWKYFTPVSISETKFPLESEEEIVSSIQKLYIKKKQYRRSVYWEIRSAIKAGEMEQYFNGEVMDFLRKHFNVSVVHTPIGDDGVGIPPPPPLQTSSGEREASLVNEVISPPSTGGCSSAAKLSDLPMGVR